MLIVNQLLPCTLKVYGACWEATGSQSAAQVLTLPEQVLGRVETSSADIQR